MCTIIQGDSLTTVSAASTMSTDTHTTKTAKVMGMYSSSI